MTTTIPKLEPLQRAASRLGFHAKTLVAWSRAGRFPRLYFIGGRWNVRADDVARWLEQQPGDAQQDETVVRWRRADTRLP